MFARTSRATRCGHFLFTCSFLADVGQVVVAGDVVPFAFLVSDGHGAVLPACKEVIRLVLPPILINLHDRKPCQGLLFLFPFFISLYHSVDLQTVLRDKRWGTFLGKRPKNNANKKGFKIPYDPIYPHKQMITDQIGVVCPLKVLLYCAIIQSNPSIIMTQTCTKDTFPLNKHC